MGRELEVSQVGPHRGMELTTPYDPEPIYVCTTHYVGSSTWVDVFFSHRDLSTITSKGYEARTPTFILRWISEYASGRQISSDWRTFYAGDTNNTPIGNAKPHIKEAIRIALSRGLI